MSKPAASPESPDANLSRRITKAEEHLKAISAEMVALLGTNGSIADVERRLAEALDALMELRGQLWDLRMSQPD